MRLNATQYNFTGPLGIPANCTMKFKGDAAGTTIFSLQPGGTIVIHGQLLMSGLAVTGSYTMDGALQIQPGAMMTAFFCTFANEPGIADFM